MFVVHLVCCRFNWCTDLLSFAVFCEKKINRFLCKLALGLVCIKLKMCFMVLIWCIVKGTVHIHISPLTCSAIYQSRLFWCELPSFGDIGRRDFCLFSKIMGLNGALNVGLAVPKIHLKSSTAMSLSRNHDPVT